MSVGACRRCGAPQHPGFPFHRRGCTELTVRECEHKNGSWQIGNTRACNDCNQEIPRCPLVVCKVSCRHSHTIDGPWYSAAGEHLE